MSEFIVGIPAQFAPFYKRKLSLSQSVNFALIRISSLGSEIKTKKFLTKEVYFTYK